MAALHNVWLDRLFKAPALLRFAFVSIDRVLDAGHYGQRDYDGQQSEGTTGQERRSCSHTKKRACNQRADCSAQATHALREAQNLALLTLRRDQ